MPVVTYRTSGPVYKWVIRLEVVKLSSLSREDIRFPVYADSNGGAVDMSDYTVEVALMSGDSINANPDTGDWKGAAWTLTATGNWVAGVEVGPGTTVGTLAVGRHRAWLRLTAEPAGEIVVRQAGQIVVA